MQAAQGEDARAEEHDERNRNRARRQRGRLPYAANQAGDAFPETRHDRPARLHAQTQRVLESRSRTRRLESIVELALEGQQLEVFLLAHSPSLWTEYRRALSPR